MNVKPVATDEEQDYLVAFINQYFETPVTRADIVWTYSGVRPLYDDGAKSATAATRDYVLTLNDDGAPLLNIFGGKITTYRKLAENALKSWAMKTNGQLVFRCRVVILQWTALMNCTVT